MSQEVGRTVQAVAARTFLVETTIQPPETGNASFERRFADQAANGFMGWNPQPQTIRSYQVLDAVVDGAFRGLWTHQAFIRGTGYLIPDDTLDAIEVDAANLAESADDSTVVIGCNAAHGNYFHWITQALPAIDFALRRDGQARNVALALPALNAWQEESVRILGHGDVKRMVLDGPAKQYGFAHVEFCEILNGGAAFCLSKTTRRTYERLREAARPIAADRRKIYVARTDAWSRRMRNEAALLDAVRARGFEIIVPGELTFSQQLQIFREARLVVGAHGAGMTNIVFCDPGTIVYELVPKQYGNCCFCNLALICDLRYWADLFASEGEGPPHLRDWEVDVAAVAKRLDEIERIHTTILEEESHTSIGAMDFLLGRPGQYSPAMERPPNLPAPAGSGFLSRVFGRRRSPRA